MPLNFLAGLDQADLPAIVVSPTALRHVSILKATGLIEARFAISNASRRSFGAPKAALVLLITADGLDQIEAVRAPANEFSFALPDKWRSALRYLRFLDYCELPMRVEGVFELESVKTLVSKNLISATLEAASGAHGKPAPAHAAVIFNITEAGLARLSEKI